jgi:hypothetical protein
MLLSGLFGGKYGGKNVKLSKIINDIIISGGLSPPLTSKILPFQYVITYKRSRLKCCDPLF